MDFLFIATLIVIFLTVLIEYMDLRLQLKGKKLSKWFGKKAFTIHAWLISILWSLTFLMIFILQYFEHPYFHEFYILSSLGLIFILFGLGIAILALFLLGIKRALHLNFFKDKVQVINSSLYKYFENPITYGFWMALIGFAFFTRSLYNLIIAIEFILLMIPVMLIENIPVPKN